jgi:hypothetical protein
MDFVNDQLATRPKRRAPTIIDMFARLALRKSEAWRRDYNEERPLNSIGNKALIQLVDRSMAFVIERRRKKPARPVMGLG